MVALLATRAGDKPIELVQWIARCHALLDELSTLLGRRYLAMERYLVVVDAADDLAAQLSESIAELRVMFPCGRFYMGKYLEDCQRATVLSEHVWIPALQGFSESLLALPDNFRLSAFRAADFYSWRAVRFTFAAEAQIPTTGSAGSDDINELLGGILNTPSLAVPMPSRTFEQPPVGMSWHEIGWPLFVETEADLVKFEQAELDDSVARPLAVLAMHTREGLITRARSATRRTLSHLARNPQGAASAVAALNSHLAGSQNKGVEAGAVAAAVAGRDRYAFQLSEAALGMQSAQAYFLHFFLRWFLGLVVGLILFWASMRLLRPLVGDFDALSDWSLRFVAMRPVMDLALAALASAVLAVLCVHLMENERGRSADKALRKLWQEFAQSVRDVQKSKADVLHSAHAATADIVSDLMRAKVWRFAHRLAAMFSTVVAQGRLDASEKLASARSSGRATREDLAQTFLSRSFETRPLCQRQDEAGASASIDQTVELVWNSLRSAAKSVDGACPPLAIKIDDASAALSWQLLEVANLREISRAESEPELAAEHLEWLLEIQQGFIRAPRPELQSCRLPDDAVYEIASDPSSIAPQALVVTGRVCRHASDLASRGSMLEMPSNIARGLSGRGFAFWFACFGISFSPQGKIELAKTARLSV
jgi:hypothetical protein